MMASTLAQAEAPFLANLHHTSDADEHAACLRDWRQCYDQLSAGSFAGEFEEFCFDNVQLFREHLNQSIHETGRPWEGSHTFGVATAVEGSGWFCGDPFDLNTIIALSGNQALDFRTPRQHELLAVTVNSQAFNDYALQVEHRDLERELDGISHFCATPQNAAQLRDFLATAFASLRATPQLLAHAQMRKALEQALFATLLDVVNPTPELRQAPSGKARQLVVKRAREFMREHIEDPISIEDLCIHLGVSRRTLQYSFQDVLDLNPVKFLRALRLNGVRRALKRADPQRDTVADIAARWGFWHLSHFASEYRAMFEELPSQTLKRARGGASERTATVLEMPTRTRMSA